MQTDNSILLLSGILLSALCFYFAFKPLALVQLTGKAYAGFLIASTAHLCLILDGVFLYAALNLLVLVVFITIQRIPVFRFIEPHTGNGVVMINRVVDRYYWPAISFFDSVAYRKGKFLGVLPWADKVHSFQYIYQGETYQSLKELQRLHPSQAGVAEDALHKALG